jgi:hypothetical protein
MLFNEEPKQNNLPAAFLKLRNEFNCFQNTIFLKCDKGMAL